MVATVNASTSAGVVITPDNSGVLAFQSSSATALTIDASQNATFVGSVKTNTLTSASATALTLQSAGTTAITVDTSQNVGIGTASPTVKLQVNGDTQANNFYCTTNGVSSFGTLSSSTSFTIRGSTAGVPDIAQVYTNNTERMRIDASGNLLVGTTTQNLGGRLFNVKTSGDVAGSFYRATSATAAEVFETRSDVSSTNVQKFAIYGNGDVKNTTGSYASFSDQRIKENIVDATPKLDDLLKVRVVNYNLIEDTDKLKMIGVIAQELETVFPNLVDENLDGVKAVKYSIFIPMLIKSIQELKAVVDTQAETINALTARIVALEGK